MSINTELVEIVKLFKEFRKEALNDVLNYKSLKNNLLEDVCCWRDTSSSGLGNVINVAFKLNGEKVLIKCDIPRPANIEDVFSEKGKIVKEISDFIASLLELEIESVEIKNIR